VKTRRDGVGVIHVKHSVAPPRTMSETRFRVSIYPWETPCHSNQFLQQPFRMFPKPTNVVPAGGRARQGRKRGTRDQAERFGHSDTGICLEGCLDTGYYGGGV